MSTDTHRDRDRYRAAAELYRDALDKARDCCGCGAGSDEERAADLLMGGPGTWRGDSYAEARRLLRERYGIESS
jgi:hypothetical protein